MSCYPHIEDEEAETLAKIDETLARSRKVVKESIELTQKTASRRAQDNSGVASPHSRHNLPYAPPDPPLSEHPDYEAKIRDLTEQLKNEEFLKNNYENALKDLRDRLTDIEQRDIHSAPAGSQKEEQYEFREKHLLGTIRELEGANEELKKQDDDTELQMRIQDLKTAHSLQLQRLENRISDFEAEKKSLAHEYNDLVQLRRQSDADSGLKSQINSLSEEVTFLKQKAENMGRLEGELTEMKKKYEGQVEYNKELQSQFKYMYERQSTPDNNYTVMELRMKENAEKILELERRLKTTTEQYRKLEGVARSKNKQHSLKKLVKERRNSKTNLEKASCKKTKKLRFI